MKNLFKAISIALVLGLLCLINPSAALVAAPVNYDQVAKNYDVKVYINTADNEIQFTQDSGRPFIAQDRTFVPYRIMSEALGATVDWDGTVRKVTAEGNGNKVELTIGEKTYQVNGKNEEMDVEPFILSAEGRTYIPARFLTEGLDYTIDFTDDGRTMYIVSFTQGQSEAERKAVLGKLKSIKPEEPKIELPVTSEKIKGTPFYQLEAEQVEACLNAPMPNYTSFGFDEMGKSSYEASYNKWNYVHVKLPYKFYTDKSLVYMGGNDAYFRGYIDRNNGKLQMVDLIFQDRGVSILNVDSPVGGYPSVVEKYYFDGRDKIVY